MISDSRVLVGHSIILSQDGKHWGEGDACLYSSEGERRSDISLIHQNTNKGARFHMMPSLNSANELLAA